MSDIVTVQTLCLLGKMKMFFAERTYDFTWGALHHIGLKIDVKVADVYGSFHIGRQIVRGIGNEVS